MQDQQRLMADLEMLEAFTTNDTSFSDGRFETAFWMGGAGVLPFPLRSHTCLSRFISPLFLSAVLVFLSAVLVFLSSVLVFLSTVLLSLVPLLQIGTSSFLPQHTSVLWFDVLYVRSRPKAVGTMIMTTRN